MLNIKAKKKLPETSKKRLNYIVGTLDFIEINFCNSAIPKKKLPKLFEIFTSSRIFSKSCRKSFRLTI